MEDQVVVVLESVLTDESAVFDGEQVLRDVIRSLAREMGFRERSIFDTYDYGPSLPPWLMPSPVVPLLLEASEEDGE